MQLVTVSATASHGKVVRVDREPVLLAGLAGKLVKQLVRDLCHRPALFAYEVTVGNRGQVVGRGTVADVGPVNDTQLYEFLKIAVDGADVDVGA